MSAKENRGGRREGSGRPKKEGKRITVTVCLSPENVEYLRGMGKGKNDYLNSLLDLEREHENRN